MTNIKSQKFFIFFFILFFLHSFYAEAAFFENRSNLLFLEKLFFDKQKYLIFLIFLSLHWFILRKKIYLIFNIFYNSNFYNNLLG